MRGTRGMRRRAPAWLVALALLVAVAGCGVKTATPVDRARVAALSVGDLALTLTNAEWAVWDARVPGYSPEDHARVGRAITGVLRGAQAFERAVVEMPADAQVIPDTVLAAQRAVVAGLDDLVAGLPALEGVRRPILVAAEALRAALLAWRMS